MVKGVWVDEYLKKTREVIKPYWESHGCISYEVYRDTTNRCRFVKEQHYFDEESMERSLNLALEDPLAKEVIAIFGQFAQNIVRMRCVPIGKE